MGRRHRRELVLRGDRDSEPLLLHEFFERSARAHPDRIAVEVPPAPGRQARSRITYAGLAREVRALAARLSPLVDGECVVAILLPRDSHRLYAAQLAVLTAGAAYTCLDPAHPDDRLRFVLEDSGAVAVITDGRGRARPAVRAVPPERVLDVADPAARGTAAAPAPASSPLPPSRLAYVIYTSGTSGRPKGVMVEHRSIANLVGSDLGYFGLGPGDRVAQNSSAAYDSSIEELWLALAAGATAVVMDDETARLGPDLVPWLARERITVLCPTPTMLRAAGCSDPAAALPDLRLVYAGGEAMPADLADRWSRGKWLENGYGPTECSVTVVRRRLVPGEDPTIGFPVRGHVAHVLDESLGEVPDGDPGELCLAGPGVARGYLRRDELTAERFPTLPGLGRVYRTGDLVRRGPGGDLEYLGRIDGQVKIRGHRVELGEIEARLSGLPGVRQAACRIQGEGAARRIAAFVVPADAAAPPDPERLRAALAEVLPAHMVPARMALLDALPTTTGGKLDRRALPELDAPAAASREGGRAPKDELERRIAGVLRDALGLAEDPGADRDFFLDLGGDSLAAAVTVSALRADEATAGLTVRDLYEGRTAAALAERARRSRASGPARPREEERNRPGILPAFLVPGAWILGVFLVAALVAWALVFLLLPAALEWVGTVPLLLLLPPVAFAAALLRVPLAVGATVLAKRLLVGRYRARRVPLWGSFHLRHWIVGQVARSLPWNLVAGTVFSGALLRALGARVGKRVHVHRGVDFGRGGWDLLEIGDDATLARDGSLRLSEAVDGELVFGPVSVGARATVDVRAGLSPHSAAGDDSFLSAHSWLPPGTTIPAGERWDGIPATAAGPAPAAEAPSRAERTFSPVAHGLALVAARLGLQALLATPALAVLCGLAIGFDVDADAAIRWLYGPALGSGVVAILFAIVVFGGPLSLLLSALAVRAIGAVRAGTIDRFGSVWLRVWLASGLLEAAGTRLSGSLFWPPWLRLAGMRIGRNCEISTIIDVVPGRVEIGDETFLADGIYLGGPRVHRGAVTIADTSLGRSVFLGNHAVVPAGARVPDDVLIGVSTVADDRVRPGSSWFGHPAFELPRRATPAGDRRLTHEPGPVRYLTRLLWESARFLLPAVPLAVTLGWVKVLAVTGAGADPLGNLALFLGTSLAAAAAPVLAVLALKWALLGRVSPGRHPLWSCWCSRWDFLYLAWGRLARGPLSLFEGTPFLAFWLRAMGARVGRRVYLGGAFAQVVDPDMLRFGDGATVNGLFQAHTFEDRLLKIDRVTIGAGATTGDGSVLFYGADVGERSRVEPHGVVMKRERLLPGRRYVGCPTREP